jgi:small GTP-binding protein
MKESNDFDMVIKVVVVGDSYVGKSNIVSRYTKDIFTQETKSTIGVEFGSKKVEIGDVKIKAQIWDTAGQERYKSVANAYYKSAKGALVVFDITEINSFNNVDNWITEVKSKADEDCVVILVGNKIDLTDNRKITPKQGIEKAKKYEIHYVETSACTANNINQLFQTLTEGIFLLFRNL